MNSGKSTTIIKSQSSYGKFWSGKDSKKSHHGFNLPEPTEENITKKGYYLYINIIPGADYGKWRLYYTGRTYNNLVEFPSETSKKSTFHPRFSPSYN